VGGRSNRGRIYLGLPSASLADSNHVGWDASQTATIVSHMATFLGELDGSGPTSSLLCVNSRKLASLRQVTSIVPRMGYLGTQRRRAERFE